jgi:hypothetical protein
VAQAKLLAKLPETNTRIDLKKGRITRQRSVVWHASGDAL